MKNNVIIPVALQVVVDDIGWFKGKNGLMESRPARTHMNRNHVAEDYTVLNEIGKKLDMKILCGLVLGEWDKDNILRGMKHATWDEENWDMASYIDYDLARKCKENIENGEYIDIAFHGLMHGYWENGENYGNPREFYSYDIPKDTKERRVDYPVKPVSAEYVDEHLEAWFKIYNSWGFTKKVESIISPASLYKEKSISVEYAKKAQKYGIKYWKNLWAEHTCLMEFFDKIVFLNMDDDFTSYADHDVNPDELPDIPIYDEENRPFAYAVMGCHWENFLRSDPKDNLEYVDKWVNFFKRQARHFGTMLSKDMAFAANQAIYHSFAKISEHKDVINIDLSEALKRAEKRELYISLKVQPKQADGGTIELYEKQDGFDTYKIKVTDSIISIRV